MVTNKDGLEQAIDQTVIDSLPKLGKLLQARQAVFVDDIDKLAESERDAVNRYREKTVFGNDMPPRKQESEGDDMGVFIADDIRIEQPKPPDNKTPLWAKALLAGTLLVGGAGAGVAASYMLAKPTDGTTSADADTRYDLGFDGDFEIIE